MTGAKARRQDAERPATAGFVKRQLWHLAAAFALAVYLAIAGGIGSRLLFSSLDGAGPAIGAKAPRQVVGKDQSRLAPLAGGMTGEDQ